MTNIIEKIKIVCKCGYESVFIGVPRRAICAKCSAQIVGVREKIA